jgi:dTDP-4-dehydrorhamnose reductase
MKILLLGKDGQVGWELQRALAPLGELVALGRRDAPPGLAADFAEPDALGATVDAVAPDVIVNAAAHTAVDRAEAEVDLAERLNARAPAVLAQAAARRGAWLVHYSTDYVFDGSGASPWTEDAPTGPLSVYGRTKLAGEQAIRDSGCRHLIFRTSWVYAARGGNFARTMLRLAGERERLTVIDDQIGAPTGADLIADVTAHAIRSAATSGGESRSGTYHLAAAGETSWNGYARHVLAVAAAAGKPLKASAEAVDPVPTSAFKTAAVRPLNSRLDTGRLRRTFGLTLPPWQRGVERMLAEILG